MIPKGGLLYLVYRLAFEEVYFNSWCYTSETEPGSEAATSKLLYAHQELPQKRSSQELEKMMTKSVNIVVKLSVLMWHGVANAVSFINPVLQCTRR